MSFDVEAIYGLLPAVYRVRDAEVAETLDNLLTAAEHSELQALRDVVAAGGGLDEAGQLRLAELEEKRVRGPLKALITVIAEQVAALEENISQRYDDQFIETCADWVVPYIGDLIGYRPLDPRLQTRLGSTRAEVANTIRFRRRKGTAAMLEQLAIDITSWDAAAVEYFLRLATTQYLNHLRLDHPGTPDLRRAGQLVMIDSPFDSTARTADVRSIATGRGRYNIPNVGLHLWRVSAFKLTSSPAFRVDDRRYLFNPLGANAPLYNNPNRMADISQLAGPADVPLPIGRRMLRDSLDAFYGPNLSFSMRVGDHDVTVDEIEACDLSDTGANPNTSPWAHQAQDKIAVDPVLGRITFPAAETRPVLVTYHYGFTGLMGGGEYDRSGTLETPGEDQLTRVSADPNDQPDIAGALTERGGQGVIELIGSRRFAAPSAIEVAADHTLELRAADTTRPLVDVGGELLLVGGDSGEITLNGLLIAGGRLRVPATFNGRPNLLQRVRLVHCTLVPGRVLNRDGSSQALGESLVVECANTAVELDHCIAGALRVVEEASLTIGDSIVDALDEAGVAYAALDGAAPAGPLCVDASTIIGRVRTLELEASNTIFHASPASSGQWQAPVIADHRQAGYVRYSYIAPEAQAPHRYACQPGSAPACRGTIAPRFTSLRYGDPGYCQLHASCPPEISRGADDEAEMGAFHELYWPQREAGLQTRLDEYLRFGLEAGLFYAS